MNNKIIKKSASLIISSALENQYNKIKPINTISLQYDYKIMLLKRTEKMRVAPNYHVYPGGKYDKSIDECLNWLEVFFNDKQLNQIKSDPQLLRKRFFNNIINQRSMGSLITKLSSQQNDTKLSLPYEISFRLCAIRETFEETGLLLAHAKSSQEDFNSNPKLTSSFVNNHSELKSWHHIVKNDSNKFLEMCLKLNLVPDIFSLHEWTNWITPVHEKHRFNTFFFTCFLPQIPSDDCLDINRNEINSLEFYTPEEALNKHKSGEIKFIPPQLYEFNRIKRFQEFRKFSEYSLNRQKYGLVPWLPKFSKDLKVGLLPGDFMYDLIDNTEQGEGIKFETDDNLMTSEKRLNRILRKYRDKNSNDPNSMYYQIVCNFDFDGMNAKA